MKRGYSNPRSDGHMEGCLSCLDWGRNDVQLMHQLLWQIHDCYVAGNCLTLFRGLLSQRSAAEYAMSGQRSMQGSITNGLVTGLCLFSLS